MRSLPKELDVVNQQDIDGPVLVTEAGLPVVAHGIYHLVGELFTRDVRDGEVRVAALHLMPNGVHQVRLAKADTAVQEKRVISLAGALGHCERSRMSELVAATNDEVVEQVARVELRG